MKSILKYFGLILLFTSCEKALFEEDLASEDPQTNLEYLWNECDEKYTYFDLKAVNWDSIKTVYAAKVFPGMSDDSLFNVMGAMLEELKDDHANLFSNFNISFFGTEFLGQDNFDWRIIVDNYLSQDYYISGPFSHDFIANNEIGYIRLARFPGTISQQNLNFILDRYKDTKGLILDLRENGGGSISDVFELLSRLIDEETLVYYSRIKTGPEHDDLSAPEPVYITPHTGIRYQEKVVILTDRGTYSASSLTALSSKAIPEILLIGDTTGGGLGMPNGGQLPNGWTYRFSVTQSLTLDQKPDYENGVPPDILISVDWSDLSKDEILERAIMEIL